MRCFFVTDMHGSRPRYRALFERIEKERPDAVFFGGDLLPLSAGLEDPAPGENEPRDFWPFFEGKLRALHSSLGKAYPQIFMIFGNDDPRAQEDQGVKLEQAGLLHYAHNRWRSIETFSVIGYSYIPPTPFLLKDWERYDVSRYMDPGCVSPEEGHRSVPVSDQEVRFSTIKDDLAQLVENRNLAHCVLLFHSPPYRSNLDRAALDGKMIDHIPLDVHVGSIAIRRCIEERQPLITLHGHIHESTRLTGNWRCRIGETHCLSAAHDGPELCLVVFDMDQPASAERILIDVTSP